MSAETEKIEKACAEFHNKYFQVLEAGVNRSSDRNAWDKWEEGIHKESVREAMTFLVREGLIALL
jgi:hypothetical protein